MAALDDEEIAAFDLGHYAREGAVYEGVEGGVADEIVGDVDLEPFVRGDGRGEGVEDVGECWEGARAEFTTWWMSVM